MSRPSASTIEGRWLSPMPSRRRPSDTSMSVDASCAIDDGMARVDRHDAGPEPDALRRVGVRRQHEEAVPPEAVGHPRAVVAERLGAPRELDAVARRSRGERYAPRRRAGPVTGDLA